MSFLWQNDTKNSTILSYKLYVHDLFFCSGDLTGGEQAVRSATELEGPECVANERRALESLSRLHEDAQRAVEANDYRRVVFCMDRCLEYSPSSSK